MRDFKAKFRRDQEGNAGYFLMCSRCGTTEYTTEVDRLEDFAQIHAQWWHSVPIYRTRGFLDE